jgi:hypothetical protein
MVKELGDDHFEHDINMVWCKVCTTSFHNPEVRTLTKHLETVKHKEALRRQKDSQLRKQQQFEDARNGKPTENEFFKDMCRALVSADIPMHKLENPVFREFIEKYTLRKCPSRKILQDNYLDGIYEETLQKIRNEIGESKIWVSIDETTDTCGRYVANVIVGALNESKAEKSFLLTCEQLEKTNSTTIAQLFSAALDLLLNGEQQYDRVLLLVSDGASYMLKAGRALHVQYPKMIHVTCVAHGLHRVAEEIRAKFVDVDHVISNVKKVFLKAPYRIQAFKEKLSIPLPPQPLITRWGTWLDAALYYSKNFEAIKKFIEEELNGEDAVSIRLSQELLNKPNIKRDLAVISTSFSTFSKILTILEEHGLSLDAALSHLTAVEQQFETLSGSELDTIKAKLANIVSKNVGLGKLRMIQAIEQASESQQPLTSDIDLTPNEIASFKFAPVVSCEVERSFSKFKAIFRDNRHRLKFVNLKKYVVICCNQ